jgi:hypothetical protein
MTSWRFSNMSPPSLRKKHYKFFVFDKQNRRGSLDTAEQKWEK